MNENCDIPEEVLQYMHENPIYNIEQERRYEDTNHILQAMKLFYEHFQNYASLGDKLCDEFTEIINSLLEMDTVTQDDAYSKITDFFKSFNQSLRSHFTNIKESVLQKVDSFIHKDFDQLKKFEDERKKTFDTYRLAEEKYVKELGKQQQEQPLIESHSLSTLTFFDFSKKMESIELQFQLLLPSIVCNLLFILSMITHQIII